MSEVHRTLSIGDKGPDVAQVQATLGLPADGEFGFVTEAGVTAFQGACNLHKTGIVDEDTWERIDELNCRMSEGTTGLSTALSEEIDELVEKSNIVEFHWKDRGTATLGYYQGMARTFALACIRLRDQYEDAEIMAASADGCDPDVDALAWYDEEFADKDMDNLQDGPDTLRHLFVMLVGLGMRESSGNHWEGRDMSAANTEAETAEAGLFQTSWNIHSCSSTIFNLLEDFWINPNGFRPSFSNGLKPTADQLNCYGDGDGAQYQWLARFSPAFTAFVTGVGLRLRRGHWGPIGRKEVEIVPAVDDLLLAVQQAVDDEEDEKPSKIPTVFIETHGRVRLIINDVEVGT